MSSVEDPRRMASRFAHLDVLVVGDAMLDEYVLAHRRTTSCGPSVLEVEHRSQEMGGAGCVAAVCASLGARVRLLTLLGRDGAGHRFRELAVSRRVELIAVSHAPSGVTTTTKTRISVRGEPDQRLDQDNRVAAARAFGRQAVECVRASRPDVLLISDYLKGALDASTIAELVSVGRRCGSIVIIDTKRTDVDCVFGAHVVKPTHLEFARAIGLGDELSSREDLEQALVQHRARFGSDFLVVTCGAGGLHVADEDGVRHIPALAIGDSDPVGAGDVVAALLGMSLAGGESIDDAASVAATAGALMAATFGTRPPTFSEFSVALLCQRPGVFVHQATLVDKVAWWRNAGLRIGFTNGCFDLLHPGHVAGLNTLARHVDRVVVGLNSDASIRRLKGVDRPICDVATRASLVANLAAADTVAVFDQDTPLQLIETVRPDVLAKGGDYRRETIVGADFVESYGGRILLTPLVPGFSTTSLAGNIREASTHPPSRPMDS